MKLEQSKRQQVKLRLGISGASGFGKTKSSLLLAYGMTNDWSKIAVIDTENSSASLYSDLGNYLVLNLEAPYSPERYVQAIEVCENGNMEVIIIDSISHEWSGTGGCLDIHNELGGRFQDWAKVSPRHQAMIDKILHSKCHVITTTRRKQEYDLDRDKNGKLQVQKLGTKEITKDGFEYELTINFEIINERHLVKASKDRTGLFVNQPEFVITPKVGHRILNWCNNGMDKEGLKKLINTSKSITALSKLYFSYPDFQKDLQADFQAKKEQLQSIINLQNFSTNGTHTG